MSKSETGRADQPVPQNIPNGTQVLYVRNDGCRGLGVVIGYSDETYAIQTKNNGIVKRHWAGVSK